MAERRALDGILFAEPMHLTGKFWGVKITTKLPLVRFQGFYLVYRAPGANPVVEIAEFHSGSCVNPTTLFFSAGALQRFQQAGGAIEQITEPGFYLRSPSDEWLWIAPPQ